MDEDWNLARIARVLGGWADPTGETRNGVYAIRVVSARLGMRLKLELVPERHTARLFLDRDREPVPSFVGRVDIRRVSDIVIDEQHRTVTFRSNHGYPCEMSISSTGAFRVMIDGVPA